MTLVTRIAAVAGLAALGCHGGPPPAGLPPFSRDAPQRSALQVLALLRPAPRPMWERTIRELAIHRRLYLLYAWKMESLGELCAVFEVRAGDTPANAARSLARHPGVSTAHPNQIFTTLAADPYRRLQHAAEELHLAQAHRLATGRGVRVALVDTGVDVDHPDLRGRVGQAHNFVDGGEQSFTGDIHGTAVAGVLAASANDVGIVGVAPEADLLALKACWPERPGSRQALCNSYTLAKAIDFALAAKAQVLNLSLAGPDDPILGRLLGLAIERGIAVVAAAGPDGEPGLSFPASVAGVIGVRDGGSGSFRASPAANDPAQTLAAPAVDIITTVPRASYDYFSGSSFAAAQVSGIAALMLERRPEMTPAEVRRFLLETARPQGVPAVGVADACAPLERLAPGASCE